MTNLSARRLLLTAVLSLGTVVVPAASAASLLTPVALLTGKASPCTGRVLSQPFLRWNDSASYFPVPGGAFEGGAPGWSLTGGASVKAGGNTFLSGDSALSLPAGSSATSPAVCVDLGSPTVRAFVSGSSGSVAVSVTSFGLTLPVGIISSRGAWQPTPAMVFLTNTFGALSVTGTVTAQFRFTALGGDAKLDDVYVDPYRRT